MVTEFEKAAELRELFGKLELKCFGYSKNILKKGRTLKERVGLIYDERFPDTNLKPLDKFFREAIKHTIATYCGLVKEKEIPKIKKADGLLGKIIKTDLDWSKIDEEDPLLKEIEGHISKRNYKILARRLGENLGTRIYRQKSKKIIQQLMNKEYPNHTTDFFNAKDLSTTLDRLYKRIRKWMKNERKTTKAVGSC